MELAQASAKFRQGVLGPGSDEAFDRAVASLGRDGMAEVLCLLGYYGAVAIAMKLHRVPIPPAV